jgi:hypothetical protein
VQLAPGAALCRAMFFKQQGDLLKSQPA